MKRVYCLFLATGAIPAQGVAQQTSPFPSREISQKQQAIREASEQDHQLMMGLLHIDSLRPGYDGGALDIPAQYR